MSAMAEGPIGLYTCLRTQVLVRRGNCKEARWDPLTGRPRMTASRDGPAIDLATADRELAIDGLLPRAGGVVAMKVPRSS